MRLKLRNSLVEPVMGVALPQAAAADE